MLVLTRSVGEELVIETAAGPVRVQVARVKGDRVAVGITAPGAVKIVRGELEKNKSASPASAANDEDSRAA